MNEDFKELSRAEVLFVDHIEFYADSVEWCPIESYAEFVACGTYQLEENETKSDDTQTRKGNINLYKLFFLENEVKFEKVSTFSSSGVLDMKWCPTLVDNLVFLAVACSDGQVMLLKLFVEESSVYLSLVSSLNLATNIRNMILSLDWLYETNGCLKIVASDTLGCLNYIELKGEKLFLLESWNAHNFEAWISAFDYSQPNIIYSGGDDCKFKGWDTRNPSSTIFVNKRHTMGVTAISKSKLSEHLLVTGSYDENVLLWDTRSLKSPVSEKSLGGGIWRLKWHPQNSEYLLSASMHNGFHILSVTNCDIKEVEHYKKHDSLAYGVDWHKSGRYCSEPSTEIKSQDCVQNLVGSCSFYDKLFHIWKINL